AGEGDVVGTLATRRSPASSTETRSVKVPPMSIPQRTGEGTTLTTRRYGRAVGRWTAPGLHAGYKTLASAECQPVETACHHAIAAVHKSRRLGGVIRRVAERSTSAQDQVDGALHV